VEQSAEVKLIFGGAEDGMKRVTFVVVCHFVSEQLKEAFNNICASLESGNIKWCFSIFV
jgi:hypothetical protein